MSRMPERQYLLHNANGRPDCSTEKHDYAVWRFSQSFHGHRAAIYCVMTALQWNVL
jgi:hypothetical protein